MRPDLDRTNDPWIFSQTRIRCQTRYQLGYTARCSASSESQTSIPSISFFLPFAFFFFLVNFDESLLTSVTFCFCGNRVSPLGGSTGTLGATGNVSKSRCSLIFSADILSTSIFRASRTIAAFAYSESLFGNSCWFFFWKINKIQGSYRQVWAKLKGLFKDF